jgi:pre-mRNA-splicing helicase BRR2
MANAKDVGEWLGAPQHALFAFPPGVRPVPLEIHITGLDIHNFEARMQVSGWMHRCMGADRANALFV